MSRYSTVRTELHLPATEEAVLERWREDGTFVRSIAQRADAPLYGFDDGPPFATGLPHYGHILTSYVKDVAPRYFTMRGYRVPRRWRWDCHGLPVEYEVEKELGLSGPGDIAALGLERFTEACRALVLRYATEWERIVTRLGRWVDFKDAYRTMGRSYMDSVLWAFHRLHELGLVYEGQKVVPYGCRCQTPLSNFEARDGVGQLSSPQRRHAVHPGFSNTETAGFEETGTLPTAPGTRSRAFSSARSIPPRSPRTRSSPPALASGTTRCGCRTTGG